MEGISGFLFLGAFIWMALWLMSQPHPNAPQRADREVRPWRLVFGSTDPDFPIVECKCGRWKDKNTGEHLETMTWSELEEKYEDKCNLSDLRPREENRD